MRLLIAALPLLLAAPASAGVVSATPNAFHVRASEPVVATPEALFGLLIKPSLWWDSDHTYSRDAANLKLELKPGGCFCEMLPEGGFVEHLRLLSYTPGKELVLEGMLGPLRGPPASGVMTFRIDEAGSNARITMDYKVTGFPAGDGPIWAKAVDEVLSQQMKRLRTRAASGGAPGNPL